MFFRMDHCITMTPFIRFQWMLRMKWSEFCAFWWPRFLLLKVARLWRTRPLFECQMSKRPNSLPLCFDNTWASWEVYQVYAFDFFWEPRSLNFQLPDRNFDWHPLFSVLHYTESNNQSPIKFWCLEDNLDFPLGFVTEIISGALDSFGLLTPSLGEMIQIWQAYVQMGGSTTTSLYNIYLYIYIYIYWVYPNPTNSE